MVNHWHYQLNQYSFNRFLYLFTLQSGQNITWEKTIQLLSQALKQLDAGDVKSAIETAKSIVDEDTRAKLLRGIQDIGELVPTARALYMDLFNDVTQQVLNEAAFVGVAASIAIAAREIYNLRKAWAAIAEADNIISECRKQFETIRTNMAFLEKEAEEMKRKMENIESLDLAHQFEIAIEINEKMSMWQEKYKKTLRIISDDIKVKIQGKVQTLNLIQHDQEASRTRNAMQCGLNFSAAIILAGAVNPGIAIAQGVMAGVFGILAIANDSAVTLTKSKLENLRQTMKEAEKLEDALEAIFNEIRKIEGWYLKFKKEQMERDRNQAQMMKPMMERILEYVSGLFSRFRN